MSTQAPGGAIERLDLPPVWSQSLLPRIQAHNAATSRRLVVLDDDPMAGQALYGVPVLTRWDNDALLRELRESPVFCLLTNSRALSEADAVSLATTTGAALREAAATSGYEIIVAARGDSTLRGHFPAETDALVAAMRDRAQAPSSCLFVPYFGDGGRYTIEDTQYVLEHDTLIPVADTEFAADPLYPFTQSYLPSWCEERSGGRIRAADVVCIGLDEIRRGGPDVVAAILSAAPDGAVIVANAAADRDLEVIAAAVIEAESAGKHFTYRAAAPFVRVRAGLAVRPWLTADEVQPVRRGYGGGLIVVGSYVDRSTAQLDLAMEDAVVDGIELRVDALLSESADEAAEEVNLCAGDVTAALEDGRNVILYTSRGRRRHTFEPHEVSRRIGAAISSLFDRIEVQPRFLMVKGGTTASDIALGSLAVRRAEILGQLMPGVPVWRLGAESRFPGLTYVIFPGNVGTPESLLEAIRLLDEG